MLKVTTTNFFFVGDWQAAGIFENWKLFTFAWCVRADVHIHKISMMKQIEVI